MELARSVRAPHPLLIAKEHGIVLEPVAGYTDDQNARAEEAIRIAKTRDKFVGSSAAPTCREGFWPDALRHFCRLYVYWLMQRLVGEGKAGWSSAPRATSQLGHCILT
jgi:hypothetical protein